MNIFNYTHKRNTSTRRQLKSLTRCGALAVTTASLTVVSAVVAAQKPGAAPASPAGKPASSPIVLTGVTIIDVTNGQRNPDQTVVISGNRVQSIGAKKAVQLPPQATTIDLQGKFLIPGLWDMHAHVDNNTQFYPIFVANGVTALREMAQRFPFGPDSFIVWQRQIMAGTRVGPRVWGPSADLTYEVSIETPQDAVRIVDSLKKAGALFLKVHDDNMDPALYFAVAHEARKIGIPFVGHIPVGVNEVQASDSGQLMVEHVEENHSCWPNWPASLDSLAEQRCAPIAAAYVRNGTWIDPTLAGADYVDHNIPNTNKFISMMHHWGVPMVTGTDFVVGYMRGEPKFQPGRSIQDEVILLVGGGLTPLEAIQAGTLNPAKFFKATDSLGTVAPGKLADILVLDADPLVDINNVRKIRAVIANGRYFDRPALDTLLAKLPAASP